MHTLRHNLNQCIPQPDAKTAIKIAVAVWEPIFGERQVANEKPYRARLLANSVGKVSGSLPRGTNADSVGGVMTAEIAKDDGRILKEDHTR
jgi:hypothetical protein